jgi:hypothetical protein
MADAHLLVLEALPAVSLSGVERKPASDLFFSAVVALVSASM